MPAAVQVLVVLAGLLVSAGAGSFVVRGVLHLASRSADAGAEDPDAGMPGEPVGAEKVGAAASDGPEGPRARAALRGGTWIGVLERVAVTLCVVLDETAGIALVVAVKGLGRYPELRENPGASERFVIGTFASLLWAVAVGVGLRAILP